MNRSPLPGFAAVLVAVLCGLALLGLSVAAGREGNLLQERLDRGHALSEANSALQQSLASGHELDVRQTLDELLHRRDLGFRFLSLRDDRGRVLAAIGRYDHLPLGFFSAGLRQQLREVLYAASSRYGRITISGDEGTRVALEFALGAPQERAVHDVAVARLRRDAWLMGLLAVSMLAALVVLWRRYRVPPSSLRQRFDQEIGAATPVQRRQEAALTMRGSIGSAFDQLGRGLLVVDRDARVLSLNTVAEQLIGWSADTAVGRPVYSIFHLQNDSDPGEPQLTPAEIALQSGRESPPTERMLRARDGRITPVEVMAALLLDEHGVTEGAVMLFHDVARRHDAMHALRREMQLSQGVIDHLVEGVLTTDRAGVVRSANARALRMFAYGRGELEGVTISKLMPVPFLNSPGVRLTDYVAAQTGARLPKVVGWRKDATTFPVELVVEPMRVGADEGLVVIIRDITERLRTENLSLRLGRLLDNASDEVYIFDAQSLHFLEVNRGARRNLGYEPQALTRMTPLSLAPGLDVLTFHGYLNRLRGGELEHLIYRAEHRRADGSTYPVEVRLNFSRDEEPPVFMAVATDLSTQAGGENVIPMPRRDRSPPQG
jgi:PAS domain S-box-containing protein